MPGKIETPKKPADTIAMETQSIAESQTPEERGKKLTNILVAIGVIVAVIAAIGLVIHFRTLGEEPKNEANEYESDSSTQNKLREDNKNNESKDKVDNGDKKSRSMNNIKKENEESNTVVHDNGIEYKNGGKYQNELSDKSSETNRNTKNENIYDMFGSLNHSVFSID